MMVRDAYEDGNDRMFLEYYTMDDIDIPTLEGYRVMFKTNNPEHIWNSLDHKEFLMQPVSYTHLDVYKRQVMPILATARYRLISAVTLLFICGRERVPHMGIPFSFSNLSK